MSISTRCPACQAKLKIRDKNRIGTQIGCPRCGRMFTLKVSDEAALAADDEDPTDQNARNMVLLLAGLGGAAGVLVLLAVGIWFWSSAPNEPLDANAPNSTTVASGPDTSGATEPPPPIVVDPDVQAALDGAAPYTHLYVRFEPTSDGQLTAFLRSDLPHDTNDTVGRQVTAKPGHGFPLVSGGGTLTFTPNPSAPNSAIEASGRQGDWRLSRLKLLDQRGDRLNIAKGLWSPDGRYLFLLTTDGGVTRIDATTWRVDFAHAPEVTKDFVRDIAITSAGLVALQVNSSIDRRLSDGPWTLAQITETSASNVDSLSLWDISSLRRIQSWRFQGGAVAGSPQSPYAYVALGNRLAVVDTVRGELVNTMLGTTVQPRSEVSASASAAPPTPGVEWGLRLEMSSDGRSFFSFASYVDETREVTRFRVQGATLHCEQRWRNIRSDRSTRLTISCDGQYLCVPNSMDGPGCVVRSAADISKLVGVAARVKNARQFALDPALKAAYVFQPNNEFGGQGDLAVVQKSQSATIKLDATIKDFFVRPKSGGAFVHCVEGLFWLEGGRPEAQWPFEGEAAAKVVGADAEPLVPRVPEQPLVPDEKVFQKPLRIKALWADWTPDGRAFLAADTDGVLHRFDAETQRETLQVIVGPASRYYSTSSGVVAVRENDTSLTLIDPNNLRPVRSFTNMFRSSAHRALPLIAAFQENDIVIVDGPSGEVRHRVRGDALRDAWPDYISGKLGATAIGLFPDGERLMVYQREFKVLKLDGESFVIEQEFRGPSSYPPGLRLVVDPQGTGWALDDVIFAMKDGLLGGDNTQAVHVEFGPTGYSYTVDEEGDFRILQTPKSRGILYQDRGINGEGPVRSIAINPVDPTRLIVHRRDNVHLITVPFQDPAAKP